MTEFKPVSQGKKEVDEIEQINLESVSRERVRQINKKVIKKIKSLESYHKRIKKCVWTNNIFN